MQNSQSTLSVINCALADRAACCVVTTTTTMHVCIAATTAASIAARRVVVATLLYKTHESCKTCYTPRGRDIRRVSDRSKYASQMNRFAFMNAERVRRRMSSRIGPPRTVVCVEGTRWVNRK